MHFDPNEDQQKDLFAGFSPDFLEDLSGTEEPAPQFSDDAFFSDNTEDTAFDFSEFDHPSQFPAQTEEVLPSREEDTESPVDASEPAPQEVFPESPDFQLGDQEPHSADLNEARQDIQPVEQSASPAEQDVPLEETEVRISEEDSLSEATAGQPPEEASEMTKEIGRTEADPDLTEIMEEFGGETPQQTPPPPKKKKRKPVKKGRPRRRKGEGLFGIPNILVTVVWCALTLLISLTLGRLVWVCAAEVLAFGREDKAVTVTIFETDTIDDITKKLARAELIHYPELFKLYASFAVDEGEIKPGQWELNTKYDYHALVRMMSPSSTRSVVTVTIPEGYTCRQIFALLEDNKVCTAQDMESYAAGGELDAYWFLENVGRGDKYCLEGFLFPDTYEFYQNDTPRNVLQRMLNNFEKKFDEDLRWKVQTLNAHLTDLMRRNGSGQEYIDSHQFTVKDVINVASMIEKETSSAQEGYTIASVIYNRLFCWGANPAYLNIDATIVYALGGKTDLTAEDLRVDSPYNTYTNIGLTPGPISNPGLASIKAALEPADTNYYFYVLDPSVGSHHFSTTQAEHEAFRATLGG